VRAFLILIASGSDIAGERRRTGCQFLVYY